MTHCPTCSRPLSECGRCHNDQYCGYCGACVRCPRRVTPHLANPNNRRIQSLAELADLPEGTRLRVIFDSLDPDGVQMGRKGKPSRGRLAIDWDADTGGGSWLPNKFAFSTVIVEEVVDAK